jgi:cysteine desulfurase
VLLAIGHSPELAHTAVRLTLGAPTTEAEVERVLELLPAAVNRLRGKVPTTKVPASS